MSTITLSELRARIYERLENNTEFYPAANLTWAINEALHVLQTVTGYRIVKNAAPMVSVVDQCFYTVPSEMVLPLAVYWEGRTLQPVTLESISLRNPRWMNESTEMAGAPVTNWVRVSLAQFGVWPQAAQGGADIQVLGLGEAAPLSSNDDLVDLPDGYVELVEDSAFLTLTMKEGGKILADALRSIMPRRKSKLEELSRWQGLRMPNFYLEAELKA